MQRLKPQISRKAFDVKIAARNQTFISGMEIPSSVPTAPPLGFIKQPSMVENMRAMVRSELLRQAVEKQGLETFEEADDFDCPDELHPLSGYENDPQFEPKLPEPPVKADPTGVPSPGGGEGAGGLPSAPVVAQEPPAAPEPAPKPRKAPPGPV